MNSQPNQLALVKLCEQLTASSQVTTGSAVNLGKVSHNLNCLALKQKDNIEKALGDTKTISQSMEQTVCRVDQANNELGKSLNDILDKIISLQDVQILIEKIGGSAEKIDDLAFQSKMLSLNASIEVAKIGKAGKGFAVVAQEIKSLAESTDKTACKIKKSIAEATQKIDNLISENRKTTDLGLNNIKKSSNAVQELKSIYGDNHKKLQRATIQGLNQHFKTLAEESQETHIVSKQLLTFSEQLNQEVEVSNHLISDLIGEIKGTPIVEISVNHAFYQLEDFRIIDVRRDEEFIGELGHIKNSKLCTIDDSFVNKVKHLDKDLKYLFVCRSGGRSARAAREAQNLGFKNIYNLKGGMLAWNKEKLDIIYR